MDSLYIIFMHSNEVRTPYKKITVFNSDKSGRNYCNIFKIIVTNYCNIFKIIVTNLKYTHLNVFK